MEPTPEVVLLTKEELPLWDTVYVTVLQRGSGISEACRCADIYIKSRRERTKIG